MTDWSKPNGYECSRCELWDFIDGCWNNCERIGGINCIGEYNSNEEEEEYYD